MNHRNKLMATSTMRLTRFPSFDITDRTDGNIKARIESHWTEFPIGPASNVFQSAKVVTYVYTWAVLFFKHSDSYGTVLVMGYDVGKLYYGQLFNGTWTWKDVNLT